jgi:hypothetical protein
MVIDVLAWTGALLTCVLCLPQARRSLRAGEVPSAAASTYWIVLANSAVWAAWALLSGEIAAGVPSAINGPAAAFILLRCERRREAAPPHATRSLTLLRATGGGSRSRRDRAKASA